MHRFKEIHVGTPVPTTSISPFYFGCHLLIIFAIQTSKNQIRTSGLRKFSLFLKENVCSGYLLEVDLSNVNDKL